MGDTDEKRPDQMSEDELTAAERRAHERLRAAHSETYAALMVIENIRDERFSREMSKPRRRIK